MTQHELSHRQIEIREEFQRVRGTWGEAWQDILELDPEYLAAYLQLSAVPWRKNHLDDKVKEFIYITLDAAATHLYVPGLRPHIEAALGFGATPEEIMEVLALTSTLGIHAVNVGVPLLVEVLEEDGYRDGPADLTDAQVALREEFTKARGYWHETWEQFLELDPEFFEAYLNFSAVPWRHGTLDPKVKEFIYIAFDASATHLYSKGLKLHIRNALGYGATPQEILEILEIVSVVGVHTVTTAAPILARIVEERARA